MVKMTKMYEESKNCTLYKVENFRGLKNFYVEVYDFWNNFSIKELENRIKDAEISEYILRCDESLENLINQPLGDLLEFDYRTYSDNGELKAVNYSLYNFCKLIKNIECPKALKSAWIQVDKEGGYFYIACESCDEESDLEYSANRKAINKWINENISMVEKYIGMDYSHTEMYY